MRNCILLTSLLMVSFQMTASQSYNKLMDLVRKNMSTVQHNPHDLIEHGAQVVLSKDDVYGDKEEILKLSDAGFKLVSALTEQEKIKLPCISIATPGTFAMKFYCSDGCCSQKYIMTEQPTEDDLDRKSHEVKFV